MFISYNLYFWHEENSRLELYNNSIHGKHNKHNIIPYYSANFSRHLYFVEWPLNAFRCTMFVEELLTGSHAFNVCNVIAQTILIKENFSWLTHKIRETYKPLENFTLYGMLYDWGCSGVWDKGMLMLCRLGVLIMYIDVCILSYMCMWYKCGGY